MSPNKKLLQVALPLDAIYKVPAQEKSLRHGHPSMLNLWWPRRPLVAEWALIFAQILGWEAVRQLYEGNRVRPRRCERSNRWIRA